MWLGLIPSPRIAEDDDVSPRGYGSAVRDPVTTSATPKSVSSRVLEHWSNARVRENPSSVCRGAPVAASQSRTVWSPDADATTWPSGEKATAQTEDVWPSSVCRGAPVAASQSRTVLSCDADATTWPSGEKATAQTEFVWPSSVCRRASQSDFTP
ncbi:hypothetical protein CKAH01_17405 [Colletotrichum kahawae]|uniref:Uncharacterized protein n=1 Tax=Colletotrichum kahawae TaxID=34407 RepID=A0AAE0D4T7_COLKA|nr:hypothetical protein CKAH01_17405 [Colletotrichum kahawae]